MTFQCGSIAWNVFIVEETTESQKLRAFCSHTLSYCFSLPPSHSSSLIKRNLKIIPPPSIFKSAWFFFSLHFCILRLSFYLVCVFEKLWGSVGKPSVFYESRSLCEYFSVWGTCTQLSILFLLLSFRLLSREESTFLAINSYSGNIQVYFDHAIIIVIKSLHKMKGPLSLWGLGFWGEMILSY